MNLQRVLRQPYSSFLWHQMYPRRYISNIQSTVLSDSIFMQEMTPSKLTVPIGKQMHEFTLRDDVTVAQFEKTVLANTEDKINTF